MMNPKQAVAKAEERKSSLTKAIEARPRALESFPLNDFFGLGDKPIENVLIHVAVKTEEDSAVIEAHRHAQKVCGDVEAAKNDIDLLGDGKIVELLFRVCRDAEDPIYPAFPGPKWMRDNLTSDQVASLMNLVLEVRTKYAPKPLYIDEDTVAALAEACDNTSNTDIPEALLAGYRREFLTHAFVMLSKMYRREVGVLVNSDAEALDQ